MDKIQLLDETRQASADIYKAIDRAADEVYGRQRKVPEMMVASLLYHALFTYNYFKSILDIVEGRSKNPEASTLALQTIPLEFLQEVNKKAKIVLEGGLERDILETASLFQGPVKSADYRENRGLKKLDDFFASFYKMYNSYCLNNLRV